MREREKERKKRERRESKNLRRDKLENKGYAKYLDVQFDQF